jgi:hypothetical protein
MINNALYKKAAFFWNDCLLWVFIKISYHKNVTGKKKEAFIATCKIFKAFVEAGFFFGTYSVLKALCETGFYLNKYGFYKKISWSSLLLKHIW